MAYSLLAGVGLALLFGGLIPLLKSKTDSVVIYEHNRPLLITETAVIAGITVFGIVKFVQVLKEKPETKKLGG
jgi:hypothetical protein